MSRRNTLEGKRERQALRATLKKSIPGVLDLVAFVKTRAHVSTSKAVKIILAGALTMDSHTIGFREEHGRKILDRYVPTDYRGRIEVKMPNDLSA